jgi:hypothetical protein
MKYIVILVLSLALGGCAPAPIAAPCYPPVVYLQEIPEPRLQGQTNKALAAHVLDLREALRLANSDKRALKEWAENQTKE